MKILPKNFNKTILLFALFFSFLFSVSYFVLSAHAAAAGASYIRCDRMKAATAPGSCLVVFTTSSTTFTKAYIKLTLDSEWVSSTHFSTTAADYTVSTSGLPGSVTAMPGIDTADQVSSNTIRFPVTAMSNSTTYGFYITGTGLIANPSASTTIVHTLFTRNSGDSTTGDTKDVAVPVIADDQIVVTATVAPTFTFVFNNNSQSLGTLSSGSISSGGGTTITITTNAANGWNMWVKDSGQGLVSANASKTIASTGTVNGSPSSLSAGTEGYVLDINETTDPETNWSVNGEYDGSSTGGGTLTNTEYNLAASGTGVSSGAVATLVPRAAISGSTPAAADYTDTITVVGAGVF